MKNPLLLSKKKKMKNPLLKNEDGQKSNHATLSYVKGQP